MRGRRTHLAVLVQRRLAALMAAVRETIAPPARLSDRLGLFPSGSFFSEASGAPFPSGGHRRFHWRRRRPGGCPRGRRAGPACATSSAPGPWTAPGPRRHSRRRHRNEPRSPPHASLQDASDGARCYFLPAAAVGDDSALRTDRVLKHRGTLVWPVPLCACATFLAMCCVREH